MVNIIKEELPIEESLRKKLEMIYEFAKATSKYNKSFLIFLIIFLIIFV